MTILTDREIQLNNIMDPCDERTKFRGKSFGLSCCGYDVRVDLSNVNEWTIYSQVMTPDGEGISLKPGQAALVGIMEHFSMPPGVVGFAKDKGTWARQHLHVGQAVLEPGWKGFLTLSIVNLGPEALTIVHGDPIAQIVFQWISEVPENTYTGKYQGQKRGPVGPRWEE